MSSYVPAKIFRFLPPRTARKVFEKCGVKFPEVDYERYGFKTSILADAWKEMKAGGHGEHSLAMLDATLQDISDVGTAKTDVNEVIGELLEKSNARMPDGFDRLNVWEKAVEILLYEDGGELWRNLLCTVEARECNHTRRWYEFSGLDGLTIDDLEKDREKIGGIVLDYFSDKKKSEQCNVEICRKSDTLCYVFAELDDALEYEEMKHPGEQEFAVWSVVHPYRVIMAIDTEKGLLAISTKERRQGVKELAECLFYGLRKSRTCICPTGIYRYDPTYFLYHSHDLHLQAGDQVSRFVITSIKVAPMMRRKLISTFVTAHGFNAVDMATKFMNASGFSPQHFLALEVSLELTIHHSCTRREVVKLKISSDDCTARNLCDTNRFICERLLDRWEVRRNVC